ncbi:ABC transporter substrate-binding protein [Desulfocicer niacini]
MKIDKSSRQNSGHPRTMKKYYHRKIFTYGFIVMLFSVWWTLCAHAGQVTDMAGQKVKVPDEIHTVYGTSPPVTSMLYAVAPELVAGLNFPIRKMEKQYLPARLQSLPVVGGWFGQGRTPNLETLMQVNPDVILAWHIKDSLITRKIEDTLAPLGFPVIRISLDRLEDYPETFRFLGHLFHREARAALLAEYAQETLDKIRGVQSAMAEPDKVSVYYAEGVDGLSTECNTSIHAELIPMCGGKNVHICPVQMIYGMEKVSLEQVMHYAPEVIITSEQLFYDAVFHDSRWQNIPAVQNHRVYRIPSAPFNWFDRPPSFMRLLGARWLLNKLYPGKYGIDIVDETRRFYSLFLNFSLDRQAAEELLEGMTKR